MFKKHCNRCGHDIERDSVLCSVCGHSQKKGPLNKIIIGFIVIFLFVIGGGIPEILESFPPSPTDIKDETVSVSTENNTETVNTTIENKTETVESSTDNETETSNITTENKNETEDGAQEDFDWKGVLSEFKLNDEQVQFAKELMNNVGIYDISLLDHTYTDCSVGLCAFRSTYRDEPGIQINFTFEDGKLFYVQFTGIPGTKQELYVNWLGRLSVKTVNVSKAVDLFSDTQGGYLNYIDYENKKIIDYNDKP